MKEGKPMSEWLKDVEKDQNLQKITEIEGSVLTGFRNWFVTRILGLSFDAGYYDDVTGRLVLGAQKEQIQHRDKSIVVSTTSAAAYAYTPTVDTYIHFATASNANRAPKFQVKLTIATVVADIRDPTSNDLQTTQNLVVGAISAMTLGGVGGYAGQPGGFLLPANATLTITDGNFVAADVMRIELVVSQ